ncbi:MAG: ATP-binding cassette domain-containing protein [Candidatus Kariarchaeaceae archaeon]
MALVQTKANFEELMKQGENLVDASNIYAIYQSGIDIPNVVALRGINLKIGRGEFVAAVGPSGSGKSSLLRCVGGLQTPTAGTIKFGELDITKIEEEDLVGIRRQTVGFVFQSPTLIGHLSAEKNVMQTLRYSGRSRTDSIKRTDELMSMLGIKHRAYDLPSRLSGGERQRVGIAVALANEPRLLLADEPTGNLDFENTENVMGLFQDLHQDLDTSFFVVTHSQHVSSFADRNLELRDGIFMGQHSGSINLDDLDQSRQIIINPNGSLNLPPELLSFVDSFGELWDISLDMKGDNPKFILEPANRIGTGGRHSFTQCPVCNKEVRPEDNACRNCGAMLIGS